MRNHVSASWSPLLSGALFSPAALPLNLGWMKPPPPPPCALRGRLHDSDSDSAHTSSRKTTLQNLNHTDGKMQKIFLEKILKKSESEPKVFLFVCNQHLPLFQVCHQTITILKSKFFNLEIITFVLKRGTILESSYFTGALFPAKSLDKYLTGIVLSFYSSAEASILVEVTGNLNG